MPITSYYRKATSELYLKAQGSALTVVYVGLAGGAFNGEVDPMTGELSETGYSRLPVLWTDYVTEMSNVGALAWSVVGSWPNVTTVFITGSAQGGVALAYDTVDINASDGDTISIGISDLKLT